LLYNIFEHIIYSIIYFNITWLLPQWRKWKFKKKKKKLEVLKPLIVSISPQMAYITNVMLISILRVQFTTPKSPQIASVNCRWHWSAKTTNYLFAKSWVFWFCPFHVHGSLFTIRTDRCVYGINVSFTNHNVSENVQCLVELDFWTPTRQIASREYIVNFVLTMT